MLVIKTAIKNKNNWSILINRSIKKKESGRNDGKDAVLSGKRKELNSSSCIHIAKLEIIETVAPYFPL